MQKIVDEIGTIYALCKYEGEAQPNIAKEIILNPFIPIPLLAEQKRIVAKLEGLLPLCEKLK